ncbi:MAG: DUF1653 domain-containing protein [Pseudomonadota bacterium]
MSYNRTFKHIKNGDLYELIGSALNEANQKPLAIYKSVTTGLIWARPFNEFLSKFELVEEK